MGILSHLFALVLTAVVPIVVFATVVIVLLWHNDRAATEERLRNTARALALAVDREVLSTVTSLELLANSEHLDRPDLGAFYKVATRALESQRGSPGEGQGSTFIVKLPLLIHADAQPETRTTGSPTCLCPTSRCPVSTATR